MSTLAKKKNGLATRQGSSFGALDAVTSHAYDLSEVGQVSNAKPVGKGKDCKYCFRLSNSEARTWPDFTFSSVYTLCYVHLFCNFMLKTKPASCFALFRRYLLFSSFHYVRSDSQSLCSVRTPRALLRGTHHHGRRHGRELTQSIPWGRMVEQVASQAPCRPIKEISTNLFVHGVLSNEGETLTLKCENHCWEHVRSDPQTDYSKSRTARCQSYNLATFATGVE